MNKSFKIAPSIILVLFSSVFKGNSLQQLTVSNLLTMQAFIYLIIHPFSKCHYLYQT